jgi:hypothetical protein
MEEGMLTQLMLIKSITTMDFMAYCPAMQGLQKTIDECGAASRNICGGIIPWRAAFIYPSHYVSNNASHFGKPRPLVSAIQVSLI